MRFKNRKTILLEFYFCLTMAIILLWPFFIKAQTIVLNEPGTSCVGSSGQVNLTWSSDVTNPSYYVLRRMVGEATSTIAGPISDTFFTDNNIISDKTYFYQIRGESGTDVYFSNDVQVPTLYCPAVLSPPAPSCQADGPHISLNWSSVSGNVSRYEIYREAITIASTTNTNFDDNQSNNLEGTQNYNYFIRTVWQDGHTEDSQTAQIQALACPPILTINSSDCATVAPGGPRVNFSWNALLGVQNYQIYRKAQAEADFSLFATTTSINLTDNLVESLSTYAQGGQVSYYVKAIWPTDQKDSATGQTNISRCAPYLTVASVCNSSGLLNPEMHLSWTATQGATLYNIYRDDSFYIQITNPAVTDFIDYLDPSPTGDCPNKICTHTYKVEAVVTGFPNFPSNQITKDIDCTTVIPPSPAPVLDPLSAYCVGGDSRISVSWTPSNNVVSYSLYRASATTTKFDFSPSQTSYLDSGIESGYTYTYWVTAFGQGGTFTDSQNTQTITAVDCTPPSASTLTATPDCESGKPVVNLSWTQTSNTEIYEIWRATTTPTTFSLLATFDKNAPEYTSRTWKDTSVSPSTQYYYRVVSKGPPGVPPTNSVNTPNVTTSSCLPAAPSLTITPACQSGNSVMNLSWTDGGANTAYYEIFRKDYLGGVTPYQTILNPRTTTWTDAGVLPDTNYIYKIDAIGFLGNRVSQGWRPFVSSLNCAPPGPFTLSEPNVYCQSSYPRADLSWTSSSNATSYDLIRSLNQPTTFYNVTSPFTDRGFGNALDFDGLYDYVNIPNSASLNPTRITLEAWIYPTTFNYYGNIFNKRSPEQYILRLYGYTGQVQGYIYSDGWRYCTTPSNIATSLNKWNHVVQTFDGVTGRVYVNGALGCSYFYAGNIAAGTSPLRIGTYYTGGTASERFKGVIDEVRIYNRALSATEVTEHYSGIYNNESGLAGLWHFDEGSPSQTVSDSSNFGNNGTLGASSAVETYDPVWVQNGLQWQNQYSWQARANGPGGTTLSNTTNVNTVPLCPPTKPGLVLTSFCSSGLVNVTLRWSYTTVTTKYEIYRDGALIKTINQGEPEFSSRTWTDTNNGIGLTEQTNYTYYVKAIGPTGLENQSDSISNTTPSCYAPSQPQNLTATFTCSGSYPQVNLFWSTSTNATSYTIYRSPTGSPFPVSTTLSSYTDTAVSVNTTYSYYVIAYGPGGASTPSALASATIGYCSPSTPSITSLNTICESSAPANTISWSDSTPFNTFTYEIYRNATDTIVATPIKTLASTSPEFTLRTWKDNSGLSPLTTYYYWVKAVGPVGQRTSPSRNITTLACGIAPAAPTLNLDNVFCENNVPRATLSWNSVANAYSYNLYRTKPDASQSTYSTRLSPFNEKGSAALSFDGVDDYAKFSNPLTLTDFSIELWMKPGIKTSGWRTMIGSFSGTSWEFNLYPGDMRIYAYSQGGLISTFPLTVGQWYHVVLSRDSNGTKLYINGNLNNSNNNTNSINATLQVGRWFSSQYYEGSIDEVRIYGRALSASEITQHFSGTYTNEADLQGVWHFDEGEGTTIFDSSGYGNHGKIAGPAWVSSQIGKALEFGGLNGYVITPNMKNYFLDETVTMEVWFKANSAGVIIDELGQSSINTGWHDSQIEILSNGQVKVRVWNLASVSLGTVSFGTWHHAVLRYNKATQVLDGFLDGVEASGDASGDRSAPWESGYGLYYAFGVNDSTNLGSGASFDGVLDEIRIYNRALSATEITEHYNGTYTNEADLRGVWHFDEGSGTIAYDQSGNSNNGTLINGPVWQTDPPSVLKVLPLENSGTYKYRVKAFGADTESAFSNEISFTLDCSPAKPDLTVTPQCPEGDNQLFLDWSDDPNTLYWSIYKKRGEEPYSFLTDISPPQTDFADTNVESGITYEYYLTAVGSGTSTDSNAVPETASFCVPPPSKPVISVTPTCYGYSSRMKIEWETDPTGQTISYNIWRKNTTLSEPDFTKIFSDLPGSATQYPDIVTEGQNYIYKVEAVGSGAGNTVFSDPSNEINSLECSTLPPFPPTLYLNLVYSVDHHVAVSIGWTDSGNEENYKVFRRLAGESEFAWENRSLWQKILSYSSWQTDISNSIRYSRRGIVRYIERFAHYILGRISLAAYENPLITLERGIDYPDDGSNRNYVDYTVTDGQTYEYQIMASNDNGQVFSNIIVVPVPIARPGDFTLSALRLPDGRIYLSWTEALTSLAGGQVTYDILRSNTSDFSSSVAICSDVIDPRECFDNSPPLFAHVYYKTIASNNGGDTESNVVKVGLPAPIWKEILPW